MSGHRKDDAFYLLEDLVKALDNAFISTWQSTHYWQKELNEAKEFLTEYKMQEEEDELAN